MNVYVIVPAYNEGDRIAETLKRLSLHREYTIVVVDDGSTDNTYETSSAYAPVLRHIINRGMGAALVTGTSYALAEGADCIVHFDADGQHNAEEIDRVIEPLRQGSADIVLGSRYLQKNHLPWTKRFLIHRPALFLQNMFTGMRLTDVHNGFRAMNRQAATVMKMSQDRMAYSSEIIGEIRRNHLRYQEVPVTISYREYGQGIGDGIKIFKDLLIKKLFH